MPHRGDIQVCTSSLDTTITSNDVITENFASSTGGFRVVAGTTKSNAGGELNISSSGGAPYTDTTFTMVIGRVYTLSTKFASRSNMGATVFCEIIVAGGTIASTSFTALGSTYSFNFTGTMNATATVKYTYVLPLFPPAIAPYAFSIDNVHLYYNDTTHSTVYTCGLDSVYNYKYGFNTQEKDDEIAGDGIINAAMFWEYDTRLGRRWNIDPFYYSWQSNYSSFNNNPIFFVDPLGLEGEEGDDDENDGVAMSDDGRKKKGPIDFSSTKTQTNFQKSWDKSTVNQLFNNGCSGEMDSERNGALSCLNALASNIKILYPEIVNIDVTNRIIEAVNSISDIGKLGEVKTVQPTNSDGKTLTTGSPRDEFTDGGITGVTDFIKNDIGNNKGIFIYAVGLAMGYHSTIVVVFNGNYTVNSHDWETYNANNGLIFGFVEDNGGSRVFDADDMEAKFMEFYLGARGYYNGEITIGGRSATNTGPVNIGALIWRLN